MGFLTNSELHQAVEILSGRLGFGKLCRQLTRLGAFVSRRQPVSVEKLAERLYSLTGGLRLEVQATYAFQTAWSEAISGQLDKEVAEKLDRIANQINDCLTPRDSIASGKAEKLQEALEEYETLLKDSVGEEAARIDMLLKAVPEVAELLRSNRPDPPNTC